MASTQKAADPAEAWTALLGRRDTPTDGIEDYCFFLGNALMDKGVQLRQARVGWAEEGWLGALRELWRESAAWERSWVLLQYTAMAWSRRGFPFGALAAQAIVRRRGLRCAVVFHEPFRQGGERWIDRLRGVCQDWVIRRLYAGAAKAIFLDPLGKIAWLPDGATKATFIPIGANIPEENPQRAEERPFDGNIKTVVVFCLSNPPNLQRELGDIAHAMRFAAQEGVKARVVFLGRGTSEATEEIAKAFACGTVEVVNLGLQKAADVRRILSSSDVMLCVRGPLYIRRGSAIAGLACGLPIVGYEGAAEGTPLADAGLVLVPYLDCASLSTALARTLGDQNTMRRLRERSRDVYNNHFRWSFLAWRLAGSLCDRQQ